MNISDAISAVAGAKQAIITGLAVAGLCLPIGYCSGVQAEKARRDAAQALANVQAMQVAEQAGEAAAEDRVKDALAAEQIRQELIHAISEVSDAQPDAVRVALGCERLRKQGAGEADLPEVCRH